MVAGRWEEVFAAYLPLVGDAEAFLASLDRPLPATLWVNPRKATSESFLAYCGSVGLSPEPIPWYPGGFRLPAAQRPGANLPFVAGWVYVQEEVAMTAALALDAQPGERVVDLCAAPGGKTAQLALRVGPGGLVVANEAQLDRLAALRATVDRLGLTNVLTTWADGRRLPLPAGVWDRVLLDVPCTGEGTVRKRKANFKPPSPGFRKSLVAVQRGLLAAALRLVKPGGVVVYSTCTFAPEENEAVLDAVLGDAGFVEPWELPGLTAAPGVAVWQGQRFREDVVFAKRFWPHLNDTGGFFVARIRRTDAPLPPLPGPFRKAALPFTPADTKLLEPLRERFDIEPEAFAGRAFWQRGHRVLWMSDAGCAPLPEVPVEGVGMPVAELTHRGVKPKTFALQLLAPWVRRNVVELSDLAAARRFVGGQSQNAAAAVEPGYVLVRYGPFALGCGLYARGQLLSQLPKGLQLELEL